MVLNANMIAQMYSEMFVFSFRMIEFDKDSNIETRRVHLDNLSRVIQYCENRIDCRRAQLLHYFGETNFNPKECLEDHNTICDNCNSGETSRITDLSEDAKCIVQTVNTIAHYGNWNYRTFNRDPAHRLTLNHYVDIFKVEVSIYSVFRFYYKWRAMRIMLIKRRQG